MPINSQKLLTIVSRLKQLQNNDMVKELVSSAWDGINPKTKLTDSEEKDFMDWYLRWAMLHKKSLNPDDRGHHYDYRGYWKEARPNFVGTLNSHLPDTYKTPGHPTFSVDSKYYSLAPGLAGSWNGEEFVPPQKVDLDRIRLRQRYAESTFNDRAVSKAGAKGAFQIMPKTYEQYAKKIGEGDLFDPEYNGRMRDAIWNDYYNSKTASNGTPTDKVRVAKALAMYNAGWGRVGDWLDKQKKAGVDIYGSLDWVDKMPWKETRDYVNFILNEKDTGSGRTNAEFDAAVKKYGYAEGGKIHIDPSKKGTFTAAASKHGKSVQAFASQVLANKENYSPAMVKKANFARNAAKWHADGGLLHTFDDGGDVEYYDTINPAIVSASLPDPRSGKGNQIAYNMAQRVRNGELLLKDVPRSYQNYVEGIVAPGGSLDVSKAIVENGVPIAAPIVGAAAAGPIASALSGVGTWLANPANQMTVGKFALPLLTGATVDQAFQKYTPYSSFGDAVIRDTGLDEVMDYARFDPYMRGAVEFAAEGLNPGYYTGGLYGDIAKSISQVPSNRVLRRVGKNGFIEEYPYDEVEANRVREDYNPTIEEQLQYDLERGNYTALKPEHTNAELIADRDAIKDTQMDMIPKTNPEIQYIETIPSNSVSRAAVAPYEIEDLGGGYMLKSLMRGNPLEKQISKNGTVNVNNIKALVGKGSKVEQAVVDKVLSSEEFAGKKAVDYNKFRKAVRDELITYERTPDIKWDDYGLNRLGLYRQYNSEDFSEFLKESGYIARWTENGSSIEYYNPATGDIKDYTTFHNIYDEHAQKVGAKLNTFTFSSPRIPNGSGKHYNPNTLGHSRTYTTADEPDVLHVMESQSDWAQGGGSTEMNISKEEIQNRIKEGQNYIKTLKQEIASRTSQYGRLLSEYEVELVEDELRETENGIRELERILNGTDAIQSKYLIDNYTSRQIQENLRYAAEKGQKKMRYPTRETAAKIEGYPKIPDNAGARMIEEAERVEQDALSKSVFPEWYSEWEALETADFAPGELSAEQVKHYRELQAKGKAFLESPEYKKYIEDRNKIAEKYNKEREKLPIAYAPEHETILRKYDAFPKQYQKLYKGADVRTVTDPKGNTWYEVDVPENYLKQEWVYKDGGKLNRFDAGGIIQKYGTANILNAVKKIKGGR